MQISGNRVFSILVIIALCALTSSALARTLYVSPVGSDLNDGSSWMRAKRTVTAALEAARAGDEIWVRYGVYYERITLKDGVSLYGGFRGIERTLSERPPFPRPSPDPFETVLDGRQGGSVVATPSFAARNYRLDGFTVRNGWSHYGGGLFCSGATAFRLTVVKCVISGNTANYGGGVYCGDGASPTLMDCVISGNMANYYGGGVSSDSYSYPTLTHCTISGNMANYYGGGISCTYSSPTLADCTISRNWAYWGGGGVYCSEGASPTLSDCTISGNMADYGGGVLCGWRSFPTLTTCTIDGNMANYFGGGVHSSSSYPALTNCTIGNNTANGGGGVSVDWYASPTLTNCIITQNTAKFGGGVICYNYPSPTLINCTVARNTAEVDGGAIAVHGRGRFINTLIALNSSGVYYEGGSPEVFQGNCVWGNGDYNYSGIPDPTGTDGNISADPLMAGYHLLPGSPCIDAGDDSVIDSDSTDFDGEARIGGNRVDIGADEFHPPIVQGWMTFSDYVGTPPLWVPFEVRADTTTVKPVLIAPDGSFVVPGVPVGQFALSVKPLSYLRRTVEVDTTWGSVPGLRLELVNGDVDGDNEVTLFDFGRLVAAFGSAPGDANWDENADLDGDEEVTLFDFGILVRNFGEMGDD